MKGGMDDEGKEENMGKKLFKCTWKPKPLEASKNMQIYGRR